MSDSKQEAELITTDDLTQGMVLSDNLFNRFDDEIIDRYFNDDGKKAIQDYVESHTTKLLNEQLDRLYEELMEEGETVAYQWQIEEAIENERNKLK